MKKLQNVHGAITLCRRELFCLLTTGFRALGFRGAIAFFAITLFSAATVGEQWNKPSKDNFMMRGFVCAGLMKRGFCLFDTMPSSATWFLSDSWCSHVLGRLVALSLAQCLCCRFVFCSNCKLPTSVKNGIKVFLVRCRLVAVRRRVSKLIACR